MKFGLFLGAASALVSFPALSATIVDTGPPEDDTTGPAVGTFQHLAAEFALAGPTTITSIEAWFRPWAFTTGPATVRISITNDGGEAPGASALFSATHVTSSPNQFDGLQGLNWTLATGTYWVMFEGLSASSPLIGGGAANGLGNEAYRSGAVNAWQEADGQNLSIRIRGDATTLAVPEPATWAMMLVGFGTVGYAIRRRRIGQGVAQAA